MASDPRSRAPHRVARPGLAPVLVLTLAIALLAACGSNGDGASATDAGTSASAPAEAINGAAEAERAVRVVEVAEGELRATRRASVTVRPSRESRVASGANGRVLELLVREGDVVQTGQGLMRLGRDRTEAHRAGTNSLDDFAGGFHLLQRNGGSLIGANLQ